MPEETKRKFPKLSGKMRNRLKSAVEDYGSANFASEKLGISRATLTRALIGETMRDSTIKAIHTAIKKHENGDVKQTPTLVIVQQERMDRIEKKIDLLLTSLGLEL